VRKWSEELILGWQRTAVESEVGSLGFPLSSGMLR